MDFPSLVPSSRQFDAGDWPVRSYKAMDGFEIRLLYGSKRTGMKLSLVYQAIQDQQAESFLDHYRSVQGTFQSFTFPDSAPKGGWSGSPEAIGASNWNNKWRYEGPPQIQQLRPGVSTVSVNLLGVLSV